jgi:hypothetical protein
MSETILAGKGCFKKIDSPSGDAGSPISVEGIDSDEGIIFTSILPSDTDLTSVIPSLNKKQRLVVFGSSVGSAVLSGAVLGGEDTAGRVASWFAAKRVSKSNAPVTISAPGGLSVVMYMVSIKWDDQDAATDMQFFSITGVIENFSGRT